MDVLISSVEDLELKMESQLHEQAVKGDGTTGRETHNIHDFERYKKRTDAKFQQRKGTKVEENVEVEA